MKTLPRISHRNKLRPGERMWFFVFMAGIFEILSLGAYVSMGYWLVFIIVESDVKVIIKFLHEMKYVQTDASFSFIIFPLKHLASNFF